MEKSYIKDWVVAGSAKIPRVYAGLNFNDHWNNILIRLSFNRDNYKVDPGLYAIGSPTPDSDVFVSANYKLSFDALRKELTNIDAWILVLDTRGINVWCAAGKGTFGTAELVRRIKTSGLTEIVNHKKLIVPQLGAPGIAAFQVKKQTGFTVIYGPVRAADIKEFIIKRYKATAKMRQVTFNLFDRLKLVSADMVQRAVLLFIVMAAFVLLSGLHSGGYSFKLLKTTGLFAAINLFFAYFAGTFLAPILLPMLPGRAFFIKGLLSGLAMFIVSYLFNFTGSGIIEPLAWLLIIPAVSSFIMMNFTGSSTYTSLSGVVKEMKIGVPIQIASAAPGGILWLIARFI